MNDASGSNIPVLDAEEILAGIRRAEPFHITLGRAAPEG